METQQEQQAVNILARTHLSEHQVQAAIFDSLRRNDELQNILADTKVRMITQWQTSKWNDPDALVHVIFVEVPDSVVDENDDDRSLTLESPAVTEPLFKEKKGG